MCQFTNFIYGRYQPASTYELVVVTVWIDIENVYVTAVIVNKKQPDCTTNCCDQGRVFLIPSTRSSNCKNGAELDLDLTVLKLMKMWF